MSLASNYFRATTARVVQNALRASATPDRPAHGDWFLIERSEEDAHIPREPVAQRRDETGLATLVEVTKA